MPDAPQPRPLLNAFLQLGIDETACYALYRFGLLTGHYRRLTSSHPSPRAKQVGPLTPLKGIETFSAAGWKSSGAEAENAALYAHANEICLGKVRLFGADPVPLELVPPGPLAHWTEYELGRAKPGGPPDIKFTWEPARFGWAFILGKAYHDCGNQDYAQTFWRYTETFWNANPPYEGPHWISAQEAALRLIALVFCGQLLANSPHSTPQRQSQLAAAVAYHARRISPTLVYARSQNNNHLLSEAAGLYTAGLALPDHPEARHWRELGWKWFNRALRQQIAEDGSYSQHSTNYHRLMLQLSLWMDAIKDRPFPPTSRQRLAAAANWLANLLDPISGYTPDLGANDGAYFFPLGTDFADFRPVTAQALQYFTGEGKRQSGNQVVWSGHQQEAYEGNEYGPQVVMQHPWLPSWAYLRVARFNGRPSHADQLHLDLWWQGLNLALDAGTFQYNAPPPWDNALAVTAVHNTILVDGQDQMTRAGRFLWLDWAQAEVIGRRSDPTGRLVQVDASHDGYAHLAVRHWRRVNAIESGWTVTDDVLPIGFEQSTVQHTVRLHWLLPDWPWELHANQLTLHSPKGLVQLTISKGKLILIRAGEVLIGQGAVQPTWGWHSPTYSIKQPALALVAEMTEELPLTVVSEWILPKE